MKLKIISTDNAPAAIGPYSQAIVVDKLIYISGQVPIIPKTGEMPNTIEEQTRQSLMNVEAILKAANSSLDKVIRCGIFLKNMDDFPIVNRIYGDFFSKHKPIRATVEVSRLPKDALIEIEATALIE